MRGAAYPALLALLACLCLPAAAAGKGEQPQLGEPRHIMLEPLTVSVFRDSRVRGLLSVDLTLELTRSGQRAEIEKMLPRLRDRLVIALTRLAANRVDIDRPLDLDVLSHVLQSVVDEALGADRTRLLIGGATIRRL